MEANRRLLPLVALQQSVALTAIAGTVSPI
jgi:hypothetical protein